MKYYMKSKLLNYFTASKFVIKNGLKRITYQLVNILLTKIKGQDLDIFLPMYNLLEYSDNYSMTLGIIRETK